MKRRATIALCAVLGSGLLGAGLAGAGVSRPPALAPEPPQARAAGDGALMPGEALVPGWKPSEKSRVFAKADLYGYIDGGAELFLEFGFDQLTVQKYRNGANEMAVEIYRMADPVAASGIYLMKCGKEARHPALKERHTVNRHQLMFVRNRYWVTVNNLSGAEGMTPALLKFAGAVASRMPADRIPATPGLPAAGQVPGSVRLVRGPFGLQSIFTLGDGDILQLGGKVTGSAANYKDGSGAYTLIVVPYPTPAAAKAALAHVQRNLDKYLKPVSSGPARLVFQDYEKKYGAVSVTGPRLEVRLHLAQAPK